MSQESKGENDGKADEILEEVRYLRNNKRYSEIVILLSQVIPKIADDDKRSLALDIYNSAKIELEKKFAAHQTEGALILKEGIELTKLNNFIGAKQKIQQSMNVFSRLTWTLGIDLAKGALLINQREQVKFEMKRQNFSPNEMMEERRILNYEKEIMALIREGLNEMLFKKYDEGILLYKQTLPIFNKISMTRKGEIEDLFQHVRHVINSSQLKSFGELELPLTKLFLD